MGEEEFELLNNFYEEQISVIIKNYTKEINYIKRNRKNITRFLYLENIKCKVLYLDFQRFLDEIHRMSNEISFLEEKRLYYIKIKERQEKNSFIKKSQ
jgi:hypothetical protein